MYVCTYVCTYECTLCETRSSLQFVPRTSWQRRRCSRSNLIGRTTLFTRQRLESPASLLIWFVACNKHRPTDTSNLSRLAGICLTLSSPVVPNCYASRCSGPHWSNPPFSVWCWTLGYVHFCLSEKKCRNERVNSERSILDWRVYCHGRHICIWNKVLCGPKNCVVGLIHFLAGPRKRHLTLFKPSGAKWLHFKAFRAVLV